MQVETEDRLRERFLAVWRSLPIRRQSRAVQRIWFPNETQVVLLSEKCRTGLRYEEKEEPTRRSRRGKARSAGGLEVAVTTDAHAEPGEGGCSKRRKTRMF